jgi:ABC-type antimicrobial peptide transport system, ATPase component
MTFSVEAQHISMIYQSSAGQKVQALDDISFQISGGTWAALAGSSGSGKSSLLHILGGLLTPTEGTLEIAEFSLHAASSNERSAFRLRKIGFVFQSFYLLPHLQSWENVALPLIAAGEKAKYRKKTCLSIAR